MLAFTTRKTWFETSGLAIFLLQISAFVFCLRPFHYGTWYQVEPTMLTLFLLGAVNALWLAVGFSRGWLAVTRPLHPMLMVMLAWVGWQMIATLSATLPWRSWFGPPAIGEGTAYYVVMLLSCLLASALWGCVRYQKIILWLAVFNLVLMAWLHFDPYAFCHMVKRGYVGDDLIPPARWADYMAFMVCYLWIAVMAAPRVRKPWRYAWFAIICALIMEYIAGSETAKMFFRPAMIGGGMILWVYLVYRPRWLRPNPLWRGLAIGGILVPLLWVALSMGARWATHADCTLATRALFNQVSLSTLAHEPVRLLIGDGWGRYVNDIFKYALVDGVHAFSEGVRGANWNLVEGYAYHAHDEALEVLLALGIPGLLLWIALPVAALWTMPKRYFWWCMPMLLAVTGIQSFWFFLPQVMAYQALCWAALSSSPLREEAGRGALCRSDLTPCAPLLTSPLRREGFICVFAAAALLWSASAQWQAMQYGERLSKAMTEQSTDGFTVETLADDAKRGGDRFRKAAFYYGQWTAQRISAHMITQRDVAWYKLLLDTAHTLALQPQSDAWLTSLDIWMQNLLFVNGASPLDVLKPEVKSRMPESVIALSAKAPLREDITAPFIYNLDGLLGGDHARKRDILNQILAAHPDHRGALWAMGQELLKTPGSEAQGRAMLLRAKALGVENVYPVTTRDLQAVAP